MNVISILSVIPLLLLNQNAIHSPKPSSQRQRFDFVQTIDYERDAEMLNQWANLRSSGSPEYVLGHYDVGFYFNYNLPRSFSYSHFSIKETLQVGDLVYERDQIGGIGHIGIVEKTNCQSVYGSFVRTIEAVGDEVQYCFIDDYRFVEKNMAILRPYNSSINVETALNFARAQLGKPYSFDLQRVNTSINASSWYCSELVYAAYLYAGLNLSYGSGYESGYCILPNHIYESLNTSEVWLTKKFFSYSILGKNGWTWSIRIHNRNSVSITNGKYNSKMACDGDALNWSAGLVHINDLDEITHNGFKDVNIDENGWATHIVASFVDGPIRLITAANNLDATTSFLSHWFVYQWVE